jgi:hypothetical protein
MPEPTPDAWAHIRYAYENTDRPIEDICLEHGISSGTLRDRMRRWRWTRRRPPIPREGPPPMAAPSPQARQTAAFATLPVFAAPLTPTPTVFAAAQAVDSPPPGEGVRDDRAALPQPASTAHAEGDEASIVPRLQSAVARVLPAIEATIARLAAGPQHPRELEQAGRALSSLTRTLRELNALLSEHAGRAGTAAADYDDMPEDIDAFRIELARRIDAFVASRSEDAGDEAKLEET